MDQAAAERKVAEAVGKKFGRSPDEQKDRIVQGNACEQELWNHAVSLQSQLSASEERVRDSFNEGILAAANRLGELMLHSPKHDRELLINAVLELRRQKEAESLLPSPPQVIRG